MLNNIYTKDINQNAIVVETLEMILLCDISIKT